MKIHNKIFICCLLASFIGLQQTHATNAVDQAAQDAAQDARLNVMVRTAFKDLKPCLGDTIRILKFINNNSKLMDKLPTILEKVAAKVNNNNKAKALSAKPAPADLNMINMSVIPEKHALKSTCHMYNSQASTIPEAAQLIQTIQATSVADALIDTLTAIAKIFAKVSHALAEAADIINHLVDLIKLFNNQNADILKEVLEQTLDKAELKALDDFIKSETPTRLCKAIEKKPCSCLDIVKELLKKYKNVIFSVKNKIRDVTAKLSSRTATPTPAATATHVK